MQANAAIVFLCRLYDTSAGMAVAENLGVKFQVCVVSAYIHNDNILTLTFGF